MGWPGQQYSAKTHVLQPGYSPHGAVSAHAPKSRETIRLIFVGNNFARKGGIVALRLARRALAEGLPLQIHIVSSKMICSWIPY
jgi:hypothetical protein